MPSTLVRKVKRGNTQQHIEALTRSLDPKIRKSFLLGMYRIKEGVHLKKIERMLVGGQVEAALSSLNTLVDKFADDFINFTVLSGNKTAKLLEEVLDITISFDQVNVRAVNAMRQNKLRLIREFTAEQRKTTQQALIRGVTEGLNPKAQARNFRNSIGLTSHQEAAVASYKRSLKLGSKEVLNRTLRDRRFDSTIQRAIRQGRPLTSTQINRMVDRYREKAISYRSRMIARTESLRVAHQGTEEMFTQAIENGALDADDVERTWRTAKGERVRGSHSSMNGQKRLVGVPFISGKGHALMYPGDPEAPGSETIHCRCIVITRFRSPS